MHNVIVFSPSRYSLYTICSVELLRRQGITISGIVVRKLVNPVRLRSEFRRDGTRLIRKIWRKLFLRRQAYAQVSYPTIVDLMRQENIPFKNVDEFHTQYAIPVVYCQDLNDPVVVDLLKEQKPELVVFTGGGLIRTQVLENSGAGVLNCHAGILPPYRGMDVIEWSILEGNWDDLGITVHFMDEGVDTGDILCIKRISLPGGIQRHQIRDRYEPVMVHTLVATCVDYLEGKIERKPQTPEQGKQYFIMHPRLMQVVEAKINHINLHL